MEESLKQKAFSGAFWSATQKFGLSILSFLSNVVLARLLTPEDYGCIGMLSIFIAISGVLVNGGFVSALIQKQETNEDDYSTVFVWNMIVSILMCFILYIAAPYISSFYGIAKLCTILRVQSLVLFLNGFSIIQTTILRKNLNFSKLAKLNIISSLLSVIVAIVLAYLGFGVWALVAQQMSASIFNCFFLWSSTSWKPQISFSADSFKSLFSYGSFLLMSDLMNTLCDNIQGLLIGKKFTPSVMGYYTQARRLEEVPTQSISQMVAQVTFPIYSKIQDDQERLCRAAKKTLAMMNFINFPLMLMLIVISKPLLIFLFTEKWITSVPIFQILCVAGLVNCMQSVNYQVVSASGRSKELFYWNFLKRGTGVLIMIIGMQFGIMGLLWGMVVSFYIIYFINAKLAYKVTNYSILSQINDCIPTFFIALSSAALSYSISLFEMHFTILLLLQIILFVVSYIIISKLFNRTELTDFISFIENRKKG